MDTATGLAPAPSPLPNHCCCSYYCCAVVIHCEAAFPNPHYVHLATAAAAATTAAAVNKPSRYSHASSQPFTQLPAVCYSCCRPR